MPLTDRQQQSLDDIDAFLTELRDKMGKRKDEKESASPKWAGARVARAVLKSEKERLG